jgi:hypothetical protein
MIEIKFRAWHEINKTMVYFNPKKAFKDAYVGGHLLRLMKDKSKFLMQFIGLKDINGIELYDGDIVKASYDRVMQIVWCESYKNSDGHSMSRTHFARWEFKTLVDPHACVEICVNSPMNDFFYPEIVVKLIGNIYENPDLLKNKAEL